MSAGGASGASIRTLNRMHELVPDAYARGSVLLRGRDLYGRGADPGGVEELITELKERLTIIIVTHNMQQAARISDRTAFFTIEHEGEPGRLIEAGPTDTIFSRPTNPRTEAYVSGRFG